MRFLINSNAPHTHTGYGVQCAQLAERLHDAGHDVAISATFGQQGTTGSWKPPHPRNPEKWDKGIRVYPAGWHLNGIDIVHNHALHWFGGDPLGGWIIILGDVWSLADNPLLADFNIAAWAPVDHYPLPPGVYKFFDSTGAVPVAMSEFGAQSLRAAGLDPAYVPLAVDTEVYKPTPVLDHPEHGTIPARTLIGVPDEVFLVGMVAMNKDPDDRKGFNEAFAAFSAFHASHPDTVLYVHTDRNGMGTSFNLEELAVAHQIPDGAVRFPDIYAYQMGWTSEMMAALYSSFDVLLAPSHGEGFCVPLIEAQACGTPVIVTDFSAQPELVGSGWRIRGQQDYDPAQHAFYVVPYIHEIVAALEQAYVGDPDAAAVGAIAKAGEYEADVVFARYWRPLLEQMIADPTPPDLDRDEPFGVDVLVPAMRAENLDRLRESFDKTNDGSARLVIIGDKDSEVEPHASHVTTSIGPSPYSFKVNSGFKFTDAPWVFLCGDDVEFHEGWLEEAAKYADRYDVIGTNDSLPGRIRNPNVATGEHADHFFVRRSYVEKYGACLDGPGHLAPTAYQHWFVDQEMIGLAKARATFTPCLASIVEHHHPGYDGRDDLRFADPTYSRAVEHSTADQAVFESRRPLIEMQRTYRGKR